RRQVGDSCIGANTSKRAKRSRGVSTGDERRRSVGTATGGGGVTISSFTGGAGRGGEGRGGAALGGGTSSGLKTTVRSSSPSSAGGTIVTLTTARPRWISSPSPRSTPSSETSSPPHLSSVVLLRAKRQPSGVGSITACSRDTV